MATGPGLTKGRLLVATPPLEDPNFDRTVVFVLEHHEEGAIGVVLNRPSIESLDEPLDRWIDLQSAPSSVFDGGPVEQNALIALARTPQPLGESDEHLSPIAGRIASATDPGTAAGSGDTRSVLLAWTSPPVETGVVVSCCC